jgi:hypothetical protein
MEIPQQVHHLQVLSWFLRNGSKEDKYYQLQIELELIGKLDYIIFVSMVMMILA